MKYKYFVSYICDKNGNTGYGNNFIKRDKPITSEEDIIDLEKLIQEKIGLNRAIILYYKEV